MASLSSIPQSISNDQSNPLFLKAKLGDSNRHDGHAVQSWDTQHVIVMSIARSSKVSKSGTLSTDGAISTLTLHA